MQKLEVPGAAPSSTTAQLVAGGLLQLSRSRLGGAVPRPETWVSHGGTPKIAGLFHGKSENDENECLGIPHGTRKLLYFVLGPDRCVRVY